MLDVELLPAQKEFMIMPDNGYNRDIALYMGGYTCVPANAEYLSPKGWRCIDTLTENDRLAVYNDDGFITFEKPLQVFKYKADKWFNINSRFISQKICPSHKVITWKDGKKYIQTGAEFIEENNASKYGHRGKFKTTFKTKSKYSTGLEADEVRFLIAYQADGYLYKSNSYDVAFHLCKERKKQRLTDLLDRLQWVYTSKIETNGDYRIKVKLSEHVKQLIKPFKVFPCTWYKLNQNELNTILDEVPYWDGSKDKKNYCYYSKDKNNADFIQFVAHSCGYYASIYTRTRGNNTENRVKWSNTHIMPSLYSPKGKTTIEAEKPKENEYKYCPSTSTGMWLMRYNDKIVITGNSGKTFVGSLIGILLALKYAGIRGLVGALTYPLVRDTTLKQYLEHLDKAGFVDGVHYTYKKSDDILAFKNGSEILFRHLQEPNKLKSLNLGFVELEEMSDIPESTFKMLLSRLRQEIKPEWTTQGFKYRMFGHTNPEASKGWIYKYFVEQKPDNYRLIQAPTTQNKFLASDYVESLKEIYDPEYYRINVLGEFGDYTSGLIVKNFTKENIREVPYLEDMPLHITCDFNVDPMCWILAHKTKDKVFYFDEMTIENTHTAQCVEVFIEKYKKHKGAIIVNGDASGQYRKTQSDVSDYVIIRDMLSKHFKSVEIAIRPFNPPIKHRIAAFNRMVCDYKGNRRLFIDPKCNKFLYNIHNLKYKTGTSIVDVPTPAQIAKDNQLKFLEHPFDAGSYLVEYYFPINAEMERAS